MPRLIPPVIDLGDVNGRLTDRGSPLSSGDSDFSKFCIRLSASPKKNLFMVKTKSISDNRINKRDRLACVCIWLRTMAAQYAAMVFDNSVI